LATAVTNPSATRSVRNVTVNVASSTTVVVAIVIDPPMFAAAAKFAGSSSVLGTDLV